MANRFANALAIQLGACNPSGIAHSILDACKECREEGFGTSEICMDPAVRLMVHQLAFLCGVTSGVEDLYQAPNYSECTRACGCKIKVKANG
jgi:hypothetical protein